MRTKRTLNTQEYVLIYYNNFKIANCLHTRVLNVLNRSRIFYFYSKGYSEPQRLDETGSVGHPAPMYNKHKRPDIRCLSVLGRQGRRLHCITQHQPILHIERQISYPVAILNNNEDSCVSDVCTRQTGYILILDVSSLVIE